MRKLLVAALLFSFVWIATPGAFATPQSTSAQQATTQQSAATPPGQTQQRVVTAYTLPPDAYKKSQDLAHIFLRFHLISFAYVIIVLWLILRWKIASKFRDIAERTSSKRFVQALIFAPLFVLTFDILQIPFGVYANWILRKYGISVQGWHSWFWDWTKGECIAVLYSIFALWILFAIIRRSPRRWWFYFWCISLPIGLLLFFLQPLVIDPMFHKFEPLAQKDPALTASLETLVRHSGENIPRERMYWMGASEKSTDLNAYVTGFGASKRIVIWDTTIAKMNTAQITYVVGHEMGHYVLHHIPKLLAFGAFVLFVAFYVGYLFAGWTLARSGARWGIRGFEDWAVTPCLLLILAIFFFCVSPIINSYSRSVEHQADQYGLEVTHALTPDSGQVAAQSFQILGEVSYDDPHPSRLRVIFFYDHPAIRDRVQFALHYDPWSHGQQPEFVK